MDNFIVSARKYRPATFASVVGQTHITSTLKNAISRGQLAHAYLFCGPRGVGKTTCARIFAKAINCQNSSESEACGECESCRGFSEGRSFNIHELDAASNNSVEDIRTLTDQVRVPPQIGKYSIYIIDEVHMLSQAAFNAFLKTLEEPPAHAVFILATTEKHKIIPTILSRCQIYDFNRIRVEDSVGYLKHVAAEEGVVSDDESFNLIAQKADGGMRDALSMFDKAVAFCGKRLDFREVAHTLNVLDYDTYFAVTRYALEGDYKSALTLFDEVLRQGFSGHTFVAGLNNHLRDLLMCKDPATISLLDVTGSLLDRYRQQSVELDTTFLFNAIALLSDADNSLRSATNQRLHVELGLMKLCGLAQTPNPLDTVKQPLPSLKRGGTSRTEHSDSGADATQANPGTPPTAKKQTPPAAEIKQEQIISGGPEKPHPVATQSGDNSAATSIEANKDQCGDGSSLTRSTDGIRSGKDDAPGVDADKRTSSGGNLSGISINNILKGQKQKSVEEPSQSGAGESDPEAEQKISTARDEFIDTLNLKRPRIANAFESMTLSGNKISITVISEVLREDIYAHQKEILGLLRRLAGVEGPIVLDIVVKEDTTAVRPIKPEDKLLHLRAKNPLLDELRRDLVLEME